MRIVIDISFRGVSPIPGAGRRARGESVGVEARSPAPMLTVTARSGQPLATAFKLVGDLNGR